MQKLFVIPPVVSVWFGASAITVLATGMFSARAQVSNLPVRAMAANITSGNYQSYEQAGTDIFKALKPDIVAIQEFKAGPLPSGTNDVNMRALVDEAFGTNFYYFKQTKAGFSIPNGIVSRWPVIAAGSWDDPIPTITDRSFAWTQIDLPGTNDLYVVSLHLYSSGSATDRNNEALAVKSSILANFPANAWILVGGDFNTSTRSEAAVSTFKTFLSDYPIPTDNNGDPDTNAGRNKPYDYILPSFSLTNYLTPVVLPSHSFNNGLVVDTRVYTPTNDLLPATATNSGAFQMQHMAVVKDFLLPVFATNAATAPSITNQPASQTKTTGSSVDFTVGASGTEPLSYQWRFNGTNISAAATNSTFSITSVQTNDAGFYTVVITNIAGAVTSPPAVLTVTTANTNGFTGLLAGWDVSGQSDFGLSPLAPSTNADNLTIVGLTRGAGVATSSTAAGRAWGGNGFVSIDAAAAVSAEEFATFSIEVGAAFTVSFTSISKFDYRRSSTGPANGMLQYQVAGGAFTDIATLAYTSSSSSGASLAAIDLSGISALQDIGPDTNVTFRVVNYGGTSPAGTWYVFDKANSTEPDLVIQGTVSPIAPSPTATAPAISIPRLTGGQFIFQLTGTTTSNYVVQSSTNLAIWVPLRTNAAPFWFTNSAAEPRQFFRGTFGP